MSRTMHHGTRPIGQRELAKRPRWPTTAGRPPRGTVAPRGAFPLSWSGDEAWAFWQRLRQASFEDVPDLKRSGAGTRRYSLGEYHSYQTRRLDARLAIVACVEHEYAPTRVYFVDEGRHEDRHQVTEHFVLYAYVLKPCGWTRVPWADVKARVEAALLLRALSV